MDNKALSASIFDLADQISDLREQKDLLKKQLDEVNAKLEELEGMLTQQMADNEIQKFERSGKLFYISTRGSAKIIGDKAELLDVLEEQGYRDLFTINTQTLTSFVKEQMKEQDLDDVPDWMADYVSYETIPWVSIRKANKKGNG